MIENPDFDINCDYASLCLFLPGWKLNARRDKVGDMIVQLEFDTSSHWPPSAPEHIHSLEFKLSQCWSKITRNPQNISLFHLMYSVYDRNVDFSIAEMPSAFSLVRMGL